MNTLKILTIVAIFVPSFVFAHTEARDVSSVDVSANGARVEALEVKTQNARTPATENTETSVKTEEIEFTLKPDRTEGKADDTVLCTADARICPDGTGVGRVPPSCEFAKCPGEAKNDNRKTRLDDDSDNDGLKNIDEGNSRKADSFSDVFVDFSDEDTQEALGIFLEIGDIKGESNNKSIEVDSGTEEATPENNKTEKKLESKKLKEIVIVGSKVKEVIESGDVQVRGWDPKKKEVTIKPEDVEEAKDLLDFIGATVISDENIEKIAISPEKIEMEYSQPAKLFGLIPMSLTAKVVLSEKEKLKVKFPWYSFLTSDNAKEVKEEIDVLSLAWGGVASIGDTELQDRALKFQVISNLLKASHDAASNSIRNMK